MIQQFQTDIFKGIFVKVPENYENFVIKQYGYAGTWLMEIDSKELNHWKVNIPKGDYKIIGFADRLSEDQKKMICDLSTDLGFKQMYVDYQHESEVSLDNSFESLLQINNCFIEGMIEEPNHLDYKNRNEFGELVWTSNTKKNQYSEDYDLWYSLKNSIGQWLVLSDC